MTRGDTLYAGVSMINKETGERYTPVEGDVVRFAVKHKTLTANQGNYVDTNPLIRKVIPNDTQILKLEPSDTKELQFGEYAYDVEITFENGDVDTFIKEATLKLTPEVD